MKNGIRLFVLVMLFSCSNRTRKYEKAISQQIREEAYGIDLKYSSKELKTYDITTINPIQTNESIIIAFTRSPTPG